MVKVLSNHSKTLKIGPTLHLSLMLVLFVQGLLQFKHSQMMSRCLQFLEFKM